MAEAAVSSSAPPSAPAPAPAAVGVPAVVYPKATVQDFLERYEVGETVGVGGFAVVKRGRDKVTGEPVAIKVVDKSRYAAGDNSLEREIQVLCKVDHPNCIKLYAVYITGRKVYIVTELVTGGELLDRVTEKGNYTELDAAHIIRQILQGVQYLHSHGIVHRDLKLENMVMLNARDDSPVKIADFGLSKFFSNDNVLSTMCGSPQYVAPEVLGVGDGLKEYSPAVDMWSVGVILFILLSGYSPFDDDNDAVLFEKIKSGNYDADDPIWENISDEAKDVVAKLLTVDAAARLTADEALHHPWVQGRPLQAEPHKRGSKQLQSAMDKMKCMAVKRDSMRQQSFKAAAGSDSGGHAHLPHPAAAGAEAAASVAAAASAGHAGKAADAGAAAAAAAAAASAGAAAGDGPGARALISGGAPAGVSGMGSVAEAGLTAQQRLHRLQQEQVQLLLRQQQEQQQQQHLQRHQQHTLMQQQELMHAELLRRMQQEQQLLLLQQQQLLLRQQQQLALAQGLPVQGMPAAAMLAALQPSLVQGLPPLGAAPSPPPPQHGGGAAAARTAAGVTAGQRGASPGVAAGAVQAAATARSPPPQHQQHQQPPQEHGRLHAAGAASPSPPLASAAAAAAAKPQAAASPSPAASQQQQAVASSPQPGEGASQ